MKPRRPEDILTDAALAATSTQTNLIVLDQRHVGLYAPVRYVDGLPTYGQPIRIGVKGQPDYLFLVDGRALPLEFKARNGVVSPEQKRVHAAWASQGCPVVVPRSVEDVLAAIAAVRAR